MDDPESVDPAAEDIDLYCLKCGYNLRGLSGDPRRCPECGGLNAMELLLAKPGERKERPSDIETGLALSVGAMLVAIPCVWVEITLRLYSAPSDPTGCFDLTLLACIGTWLFGVLAFRDGCGKKSAWLGLLIRYYAVAFSAVAGIVAIVTVGHMAAYASVDPRGGVTLLHLGILAALSVGLFMGLAGIRTVHRSLRKRLELLRREALIEIERERLRRELHVDDSDETK